MIQILRSPVSIVPNEARLAGTKEVCRARDPPLNWHCGKTDPVGGYAVLHDPDTALAGGCILPNEVRLAVTKEVCCTRDPPLNWHGGEADPVGGHPFCMIQILCSPVDVFSQTRSAWPLQEVCRARDPPLNWHRGKADPVGGYAVLHDPDTALAGGCISQTSSACFGAPVPEAVNET